jgi:hypothetical protein
MDFDTLTELATLRQQTAAIRKPRHLQSRLDRHRAELLALHRGGASTAELQRWLRSHRIKVVHSTVARWLTKHTTPTR